MLERKGEGFSCQLHVDIVLVDALKEGIRVTEVDRWVNVGFIVVVMVGIVVVVVDVVIVVVEVLVAALVKEVIVSEVVVLRDKLVLAVVAIEFEEAVLLVGVGSSARLVIPKSGSKG